MKDFQLNERQREFAERNHKVLEDFLKYRGLPQDEFYDVVVFRFLRAVKQYDERDDLKQYSFRTIANNHMRSALGGHFKKLRKQREKMQVLSLDCPISPNSNFTLSDIIADEKVDICEEVCQKLSPESKQIKGLLHISQPVYSFACAA